MTPSWHRYDPARKRLVLTLHVQPNARASAVAGVHGDALKVKIAAPAVDNKANAELIRFLARPSESRKPQSLSVTGQRAGVR